MKPRPIYSRRNGELIGYQLRAYVAKSLMGHLGHTDLATTDKYLDFISEKEDVVSETMSDIFEMKL